MRRIRLLLRLYRIQRVLIRHGLDELVRRVHLFRPLAFIQRPWPRRSGGPLGLRLRLALEQLGPLFVKFGQAVSVRRDLLPQEIADELAKLQDRVPPFPSAEAVALLEGVYGCELGQMFAEFHTEPLAAASIAQVHAACLPDGREVVVKVLRPKVRAQIRADIEVLFAVAELAERYWPAARRLRPRAVVAEFEKTLEHELDLLREAGSASQLKRNFEHSKQLYVPEVHWDYCRRGVLVIERIDAVPISDMQTLRRHGTNIKKLAENGVDIFFTQVFRHNFFHADMHPGNIFVDVSNPEEPRYVAVDFGIMGSLSARDQSYLAENFLAFFKRDYRRVASLHIDSGWVPADTRVDELESAIRAVCEPVFNRPLKDISFGLALLRLLETAREFDMEVQPQLVLLEKTLLAIEGLGRELYPELDLWSTAQPILEAWIRERRDPRTQLKRFVDAWPQISEDLLALPDLVHRHIRSAEQEARSGGAAVRHRRPSPRYFQRRYTGTVLLVAGVLWLGLNTYPFVLGWVGVVIGLWMLLLNRRG